MKSISNVARSMIGLTVIASATALASAQVDCGTSQSANFAAEAYICGDWDCNPGQGVPNYNLGQAMEAEVSEMLGGCLECFFPEAGCFPSATWTFATAYLTNEETPSENCPTGKLYRRCVTIEAGEGTLTCSTCPL